MKTLTETQIELLLHMRATKGFSIWYKFFASSKIKEMYRLLEELKQ